MSKGGGGKDSKDTGSSGKERKFDTAEIRNDFIDSKVASGEFIKHHKMLNGKPTWRNVDSTRYYHKSIEKWEIEVYNKHGNYIGVIKPSDGTFHPEMAVKGRTIDVK
jgi:hypothetical protein